MSRVCDIMCTTRNPYVIYYTPEIEQVQLAERLEQV